MTYQLNVGRCEEVLRGMADNSVDAIVTDPPYGLSFMGHKWDYQVPTVDQWIECLRVLKPGGHLLAFGGARTYHRLVVNIEDAGFEIRDQLMWIYGSGFMVRKLNRPLLSFLTMNSVKEEPHMVRPVAE